MRLSCKTDIPKSCAELLDEVKQEGSNQEPEVGGSKLVLTIEHAASNKPGKLMLNLTGEKGMLRREKTTM